MPAGEGLVTMDEIRAAALRIRGAVRRTPLLPADESAGALPGDVSDLWLKCECLQFAGAFKLRGAYNFISSLAPEIRPAGVVTYSSGNHAQGVAYAARAFGVPATVVMPLDAPPIKAAAVRRLGARLEQAGLTTTERKARAEELLAELGGTMVPPFDHRHIIAGQGTVGLEIVEQLREARDHLGEARRAIGALELQAVVGGREVEALEVRVDHARIAVLAGVDEDHLAPRPERGHERGGLHELRPRPGHDCDTHDLLAAPVRSPPTPRPGAGSA